MSNSLINGLCSRDIQAIAKAVTLIENQEEGYQNLLSEIFQFSGYAFRIGVTGPPGAGKSTLVEKLVDEYVSKKLSVAIIAVDPTSPFSGGAILGDRIRFSKNYKNNNVYFRSMATRGSQGGLTFTSEMIADVFDAAKFDIIIYETVGVGQMELDVMDVVDSVVLTLVPESGDDIQMMKSGIMEIADIYAINKSDRDGADKLKTILNNLLVSKPGKVWTPNIINTVATKGDGVAELILSLDKHKKFNIENKIDKIKFDKRYIRRVQDSVSKRLKDEFWNKQKSSLLNKQVENSPNKRMSPYELANHILDD